MEFQEFITDNLLIFIGAVVLIGVGVLIAEILRQQVKQFFEANRQRKIERKELSESVKQLLNKVERLIDSLAEHKEYDEEFRQNLEKAVNYKLNVQSAKIMDIMISEREHYKETKGKIDKQWLNISKMQNDIIELQTCLDIKIKEKEKEEENKRKK